MDDALIVKRITAIGAELVALEKKRAEIDAQTKKLINEVHRLSRPRGMVTGYDGEEEAAALPASVASKGTQLVRNGEPTVRSRVLRYMSETPKAVSKYEPAQALGLTPTQVHYCFVGLKKQGLVERAGPGRMALTERGRTEVNNNLPLMPTVLTAPREIPLRVVDENDKRVTPGSRDGTP